ncbi:LytR/AlgR family response regulator transcription factor [Acanthopleuribacter pedis]|uniref:Response regulator transcription factor n=1 Tax=Acanthopleuribacter pedis TaxID=442870 RepID=A0A8J7Q5X6_9BACT|nr:LytTR family DNA-binding domain-containing protein [Acanthopleuribacter pedis]MBO1321067.1 response regulator transcription factor [Acanthopleuribacter pedis]
MHVLIVEDEPPIAKYLARLCRTLLADQLAHIELCYTLDAAAAYLAEYSIDLCFLDLNLNGRSGFQLFSSALAGPFHTIIVSAHTDQAIHAFQYGVLDFIPKPFDQNRLDLALQRFSGRVAPAVREMKWLSVRKAGGYQTLALEDVVFFRAADAYVEAVLADGRCELLDKTLDRLEQLLPDGFLRIHRSAIVALARVAEYRHCGGGRYQVTTQSGQVLPLSRTKYKQLHALLCGEES